jgi:hypothetical protein
LNWCENFEVKSDEKSDDAAIENSQEVKKNDYEPMIVLSVKQKLKILILSFII